MKPKSIKRNTLTLKQIITKKDEYLKQWQINDNSGIKRRFFKTEGLRIDQLTYEWFVHARNKNIPISGVLIRYKAKEIAEKLGNCNFSASTGWLDKFKKRHNIHYRMISGEAAGVNQEDVETFINRLPLIIEKYKPCDTYNLDETGLFFRALPTKTMALRGEKCVGGKLSKDRLTIMHCVNMAGENEKLLVIGKSARPRAFKNLNIALLPVHLYSNNKAWMTNFIMTQWLREFDRKMIDQNRKVLLFLDNAAAHPKDVQLQNVKLVYLPPNTTAYCQPQDQGIIKMFKTSYRHLILKHILSEFESSDSVHNLTKSISVLDAIYFIKKAWDDVSSDTIKNCFKKAGFREVNEECENDHFDPEDDIPLSKVVQMCTLMGELGSYDVQEFIDIDANLDTEDGNLDNILPDNLENENQNSDDEEHEIENLKIDDYEKRIVSYKDALLEITKLKQFSIEKNDVRAFGVLSELSLHFEAKLACNTHKQTSILNYFVSCA